MEIFEMNYYPPDLVDWWMDDWISFVYGTQRSMKAYSVEVSEDQAFLYTILERDYLDQVLVAAFDSSFLSSCFLLLFLALLH